MIGGWLGAPEAANTQNENISEQNDDSKLEILQKQLSSNSPDRLNRRLTIDPNTLMEFMTGQEKFQAPNACNPTQHKKNYLNDEFNKDMRIDSSFHPEMRGRESLGPLQLLKHQKSLRKSVNLNLENFQNYEESSFSILSQTIDSQRPQKDHKNGCIDSIIKFYRLMTGPQLLDQSTRILPILEPRSSFYKLCSNFKYIFLLTLAALFYFLIYAPLESKIGLVQFEIDSYDEQQVVYEVPLDSANMPFHHISWFELSQILTKIETSTQFLCHVVDQEPQCSEILCNREVLFENPTLKYDYDYDKNMYKNDSMTFCLKDRMRHRFCDQILDRDLRMACQYYYNASEYRMEAEKCMDKNTDTLILNCLKIFYAGLNSNMGKGDQLTESFNDKLNDIAKEDSSVIYNELLSIQNLQKYLCDSTNFTLNRVNFHNYLGKNDQFLENLVCEVIVYMEEGMLLVALHHHFPMQANQTIKFSKDVPIDTSMDLAFTNELIGLDTRAVLYQNSDGKVIGDFEIPGNLLDYINAEHTQVIFAEAQGEEIKNQTYVDEKRSLVCQSIQEYKTKISLTQNIKDVPLQVLVKEPTLTKFYANSVIFTPIKEYDAKAQTTSLKTIDIKGGVEKYEMLLDNRINYRQVYIIDFHYRAQIKLQYFYNTNDFTKDIQLYICLTICLIYFGYSLFVKVFFQRFLILLISSCNIKKAVEMQEKLQIKSLYEYVNKQQPRRSKSIDYDPLRIEMIKQEIMNQVSENLQGLRPQQQIENNNEVDVKKEVKDQLEKYDQMLKSQLDEKLKKLNKIFKQRLEKRDEQIDEIKNKISKNKK